MKNFGSIVLLLSGRYKKLTLGYLKILLNRKDNVQTALLSYKLLHIPLAGVYQHNFRENPFDSGSLCEIYGFVICHGSLFLTGISADKIIAIDVDHCAIFCDPFHDMTQDTVKTIDHKNIGIAIVVRISIYKLIISSGNRVWTDPIT